MGAERWRLRALAAALLLLAMVLVWLQSRTGWLAGAVVLWLFVLCFCPPLSAGCRHCLTAGYRQHTGSGAGVVVG